MRNHRDHLQKRRLGVHKSIEEAKSEVERVAEHCISMICEHKASVTERLIERKANFEDAVLAQMASLDDKVKKINSTLEFCEEVLLRKNLTEILNIKTMIEQRLQELAVEDCEIMSTMDFSEVKYVPNDASFLKDAPGMLVTGDTEIPLLPLKGRLQRKVLWATFCTFAVL